jgi:hypothetical protein
MTSLRAHAYAVAAADTGVGGVVALLATYTGLSQANVLARNLLGGEASPAPPAAVRPYLYLRWDVEVPYLPLAAYSDDRWEGEFAWVALDEEAAGYGRMTQLLLRLRSLYPRTRNTTLWRDTATSEDVFSLRFQGLGPEVVDQARGLLSREARWGYRKTYRTEAA